MRSALVVGSGAGGAAAAMALQGAFEVTVLEAGAPFRPFRPSLALPTLAKRAGLLVDERQISWLFPAMRIDRGRDGLVHVRGSGTGGTTTIATGNGLRLDHDLKALGIDLEAEFADLGRLIPMTSDHRSRWRPATKALFRAAEGMGLDPRPTPKMGRHERCRGCGRCVLGCLHGIKWDSRAFLDSALAKGARLRTGTRVERVEIRGGEAAGVWIRRGLGRRLVRADLIVLAAGGLGTPRILGASGLPGQPRLFVDPVLCLAARRAGAGQDRELAMPFYVQGDGYMISPYFDHLSFFFNRRWKAPAGDIVSLMIKLADEGRGAVSGRRLDKGLSTADRAAIGRARALCLELLGRIGISRERVFEGTLNAGHPGGMYPLSAADAAGLHPAGLPGNVYIADSSLFPASLGRPPILTIMALALAVGRRLTGRA